jgi:ADP-ribose pyrophosphatase YjhB (NUDIX family)
VEPYRRIYKKEEGLEEGAARILKQLTGLEGIYPEQLFAFGRPDRDLLSAPFQ